MYCLSYVSLKNYQQENITVRPTMDGYGLLVKYVTQLLEVRWFKWVQFFVHKTFTDAQCSRILSYPGMRKRVLKTRLVGKIHGFQNICCFCCLYTPLPISMLNQIQVYTIVVIASKFRNFILKTKLL